MSELTVPDYCVTVVLETSHAGGLYQRVTLEQFAKDPLLNMEHQMGISKAVLGWAEGQKAAATAPKP